MYKVLLVPELVTITAMGGHDIRPPKDPKQHVAFSVNPNQKSLLLSHQIKLEDYFINLARLTPDRDAVVVFDRGYLDNMAYMTKEAFDLYIKTTGVNLEEIRDSRYDMVIHMVTAANGAPQHYTLANNKARSEGIELAIAIDNKIKEVWNGHPNHMQAFVIRIIGNEVTFNEKVAKVYNSIFGLIDFPKDVNYVRKFLVDPSFSLDSISEVSNKQTFKQTLNFLNEPETELRATMPGLPHISYVTKRETEKGKKAYYYVLRILSEKAEERMEIKRTISKEDYQHRMMALGDQSRHPLHCSITIFAYGTAIYNLHKYKFGSKKICILRIMSTSAKGQCEIPPFIPVLEDITCKLR